jgi:hypothetical protein
VKNWRQTQRLPIGSRTITLLVCAIITVWTLGGADLCQAQLQVTVHIWGEVLEPGEYYVPAGTNILELISKAGGPTEFANLGKVKITRESGEPKRAFKVNLNRYLDKESYSPLPVLQKGDVVRVSRNAWSKWRTVIRVVADVAIIANVYYWLTRE